MSEVFNNLSVIIPFIKDDVLWKDLLQDLKPLPHDAEIILVGPDAPDDGIFKKATEALIAQVRYVPSLKGRAVQQNTGVRASKKKFLWFLHADTKVPRPSLFMLEKELQSKPDSLHFFNLHFLADGPKLVGLNSLGANLRTRYLKMPFGDQGFALSRHVFYRIGGFNERKTVGEDHAFVWEARRKRVPLNCVKGSLFTSARRYEWEGWAHLTGKRVWLTSQMTSVEIVKLMKQRLFEFVES